MTTPAQAAICRASDQPFAIEPVTLDALRADEVLVRVTACGICHTDMAVRDQHLPTPLPAILGHEGAGIVEAVGAGVSHVRPGDRVIMSFNSCGHCAACDPRQADLLLQFRARELAGHARRRQLYCLPGRNCGERQFLRPVRLRNARDRPCPQCRPGAGQCCTYSACNIAPLGCGFMTGAGAVLRSMAVRKGAPIAIFGAGAVGLAAVMAAKIVGADPIIAVDVFDNRLALAKELGATHTINGKSEDAFAAIRALCPSGLSYAFDTTGIASLIEQAFALLSPLGILGMVGASPPTAHLTFNETSFMGGGKRVMGILGGDSDIQGFLPELIEYHLAGQFPHDRLIRTFPFAQINEAFEAGESGAVVKPVLVMEG